MNTWKHLQPVQSICNIFNRILLTFASKLRIPLNHFIQDDINTYYLINGNLHKTYTVESDPDLLNYTLNERERGHTAAQLFSQALWKVCVDFFPRSMLVNGRVFLSHVL